MTRICTLILICAAVCPRAAAAPVHATDPVDRVTGHSRVVTSEILGEDRRIEVHLPRAYEQQHWRRYPVLIALDGDAYAGILAQTAQLYRLRGSAPPMIVVGIANTDRTRDLTPFMAQDDPTSGGGGEFLRFLKEELLPFVDREYRTAPYRIVFGHSFGGVLGVFALFCHPELFDACLAASPALYYDRGRTLRTVETVLASREPDGPRFLYAAIGDELGYAASLDFLEERLRGVEGGWLRWETHEYAEETHLTIALRVIPESLRALYAGWAMPAETVARGLDGIEAHYRELSARYGYRIPVPEWIVNNLGYRHLHAGELEEAVAVFRFNTENYPESANTWDSLGEAELTRGELDAAERHYRHSLELNEDNTNAEVMLAVIAERR